MSLALLRCGFRRAAWVLVCGAITAGQAAAQTPTFSVDFQGPTVGGPDGFGFAPIVTEGDLLTTSVPGPAGPNPPAPGPLPPPGIEIGAAPGAAGAVAGGLGILPGLGGFVEVDALSYGRDRGAQLLFSVDELASGVPPPVPFPPDVLTEGAVGAGEASADVYAYRGTGAPTPIAAFPAGNTLLVDGDGLPSPGAVPGLGLVEPNPPTPGAIPDPGDNLDALDYDTAFTDLLGPVYFSLDAAFPDLVEGLPANTGTAVGNAFSGADVLVSFAGGVPGLAIPALLLGLDLAGFDTDDLDALIFDDADGSVSLTAGDTLYFSVRRGSAVIGVLDSAFGVPIEEGDVLAPPAIAGAPPAIVIPAEVMGLGTIRSGTAGPFGADEVDALDLHLQPTFSVDSQGPIASFGFADAFFGLPVTEGDVLTAGPPGPLGPNGPGPFPLPVPGIEIGALPGAVGAVPGGLGIVPGLFGFLELDALSYGGDRFSGGAQLFFSVDEFATGVPGAFFPELFTEGLAGAFQASADVFSYQGPVVPTPPGPFFGNAQAVDGDGAPLTAGLGLLEPNPPSPAALPDAGDNLDAVDMDTTLASLGGLVFFSLDTSFPDPLEPFPPVNSGTAAGLGFSGADVLASFAGGAPFVAIPGPALGLDLIAGFDTDDLDALVFNDADGSASLTPGDFLLFSVRRGSAVIGAPDGAFGIPIEEGDVLTVPAVAGGLPAIFIAADALGLGTVRSGTAGIFGSDDLDALDVVALPEPDWALQLGAGLGLLGALARRRRSGAG